jgi:hypothetical protein
MKDNTRWMVQLEFSFIFLRKSMFLLCLKNLLSANYDVSQNVQSVKIAVSQIAVGQWFRRSKWPSVKIAVGQNVRRSKLPSVKIAVGQNGRRSKLCRSKDLEPFLNAIRQALIQRTLFEFQRENPNGSGISGVMVSASDFWPKVTGFESRDDFHVEKSSIGHKAIFKNTNINFDYGPYKDG